MSFTYDPNLTDKVSQVRFYIQDTFEPSLFQDEELQYLLTANGDDVLLASTEAAYRLWVQYLHLADVSEVDNVRIEYRDKAEQFKELYEDFKKKSVTSKVKSIYFGGISKDRFNAVREDSSLVNPEFTKGGIYNDDCNQELTPVDSCIDRF